MYARLLLASLGARRARAAWSFLAITLGVGVATALAALALQVGDDLARSLRASGPNFVVLPAGASWPLDLGGAAYAPSRAGLSLETGDVLKLKTSFWRNNVLGAAPELTAPVRIAGQPVTLLGSWFEQSLLLGDETWTTGLASLHPAWSLEGRWPRGDSGELVLGAGLATRLALHPGQWASIECGGREVRWLVTGIVRTGGLEESQAWAPLAAVQDLAQRPESVDRIWLSAMVLPAPTGPAPDPERNPEEYERYTCAAYPANLSKTLGEQLGGAEVLPMSERVAGEAQVVRRLGLLMVLLALAALTAAALGLFSASTAAVVERRAELGLMRALGASPRTLAGFLLGESLLIALAAGGAGWLVGALAASLVRAQSFGAESTPQPLLLPLALALSLGVSLLGTLGPLRLAIRLDPATVLRG